MIGVLVSSVTMGLAQMAMTAEPAIVSASPIPAASEEKSIGEKLEDNVKTAAAPAAAGAPPRDFAPVFQNLSDQQIADAVTDYLEGLTTLQGDFVQTAPSGAVATGKIYLRRPGQIRFDYDAPSPLTIVATQGMVYVQDAALDQTDSYPLKKTPLKFLLSKKIDLRDVRLVGVDRWEDAVAVTYASSDVETEGELTLAFAAPALAIEQWAVRDPQNGLTVVQLKNLSNQGTLDNRLFRAPDAGGAFINK